MAHPRRSAGLLLFRAAPGGERADDGLPHGGTGSRATDLQVLIGHMGGPLWRRREPSWTIPKGEYGDDEDPLAAGRREFAEELGFPAPDGPELELGQVRQAGGKVVTVFALRVETDIDLGRFQPGSFTMVWPPRSGRQQEFPELDEVRWVDIPTAADLLIAAQREFLERLRELLAAS